MTYSIFAKGKLTKEHCKIADKEIKSGMIEHAYDNIIAFHDLNADDVKPAQEIMKRFGFDVETEVYEEHYDGCFCELVEIKSDERR